MSIKFKVKRHRGEVEIFANGEFIMKFKVMKKSTINRLMANDPNASWDECETLEEVAEGLRNAMAEPVG